MKINTNNIIQFFDEGKTTKNGDIASIIGLIGEDLNSAVFKHYMESKNKKVEILDLGVSQGYKGGKWLDRWIVNHTNKTIYQCEIKNWASTAIGGRELKLDANAEDYKIASEYYQVKELKGNFLKSSKQPNGVTKVLLKMKVPKDFSKYKLRPLLIYWMPISFDKNLLNYHSSLNVKDLKLNIKTEFKKLEVFSVSLYLRSLKKECTELNLPNFERRFNILKNLLS